MKKNVVLITLFIFSACFFQLEAYSQTQVDSKNAFIFQTSPYPNDNVPDWGGDTWAPNGIAHDNANWFICSVERERTGLSGNLNFAIWKIPVSFDLVNESNSPGVKKFNLQESNVDPVLKFYGHAGDIDVCTSPVDKKDYLVIPLTSKESARHPNNPYPGHPIIAFFKASNLEFVNYAFLPTRLQTDIGWCAANQENGSTYIYTSKDDADHLIKYKVMWDSLYLDNKTHHYWLNPVDTLALTYLGGASLTLTDMQGGEFTDDGQYLYITSGALNGNYSDGLHMFKRVGGHFERVMKASNSNRGVQNQNCFDFPFTNDNWWGDEPEGLTIWNLSNGNAPQVSGQLHVLVDDHNNWRSSSEYIRHYKRFKAPTDITIYGTTATGEPKSNAQIQTFLNEGVVFNNCTQILNDAPIRFPPGKTRIIFNVDYPFYQSLFISDTAYVNVVAEFDECSRAMQLPACDRIATNNYCAGLSKNIPVISNYNGSIKDVWFKINPPSSKTPSFSIETYQVTGGLTHTVIQVLSGTCDRLQEIASDDGSTNGGHAKITLNNIYGSKPLYIRVTDYGGDDYGKFGIYYKTIAAGSNIFTPASFNSGDGSAAFQHPALSGDVNGDGKTDLIFVYAGATSGGLTIRTKVSNGDGQFTSYEDYIGDGSAVFQYPALTGDVNGDGKTDLIFIFKGVNSGGLTIRTKLSNGNGQFTSYEDYIGDGSAVFQYPALTGDVNGDGKTDLIFIFKGVNSGGLTIRTKMSNGDGQFTSYEDYIGDGGAVFQHPALTGDVNGDGKTDLIFVGNGWSGNAGLCIRTKLSNGDGTFTSIPQQNFSDGDKVHSYPALTGDINGDGKADLIFVGEGWTGCGLNIRTKLSKGDGTWCQDWQVMSDGNAILDYPVLAGDINGDRKTDLVFLLNGSNGLIVRTKIANTDYFCANQSADPVSTISQPSTNFIIFPNPSNNYFQVRSLVPQLIKLRVINAQGVTISTYNQFNTDIDRVDISGFQSGIYFIEILNTETQERTGLKFVKTN